MILRRTLKLFCCSAMALHLMAENPEIGGNTGASTAPVQAISLKDIQELKKKIAEQQKEIERLQKSVAEQQTLLDNTMRVVAAGATENTNASLLTTPPQLQPIGDTGNVPLALGPAARSGQARALPTNVESPLSFKIGSADFTPFGFVDFTYIGRSTNVGSGIGTNFGSIPYNSAAPGRIGENTLSTQNSRLGLRVDSSVAGAKVLGYFEADFLGNQPTNVFDTSNSDTFRMRNIFVDVRKGTLEIMGGQDWSLMTPGRVGISPLPADIFYTQDMDTNYQAGLIWARQTQFRIAYHPSENFHLALSLENPQQYAGGSSGAPTITFPAAYASNTSITNQFNTGANSYAVPNSSPDFIVKAAFDSRPGGKLQHIEVAGLLRNFKYYNPALNNNQGKTFTATGGGGSVNGNFEIFKNFHLIANTFFSDGGGRYIFGMAPDLALKPNGDLSLLHSWSTVDGFEANVSKNMLLYSYYGGAYIGKDAFLDTNGKYVGYGYPGSSNSQNRDVQEYTIGLIPTFFKNPHYGALQLITQYSYLWRVPWYLAANTPKNAKTNMVWIDLRYTLP
ncbi:MAG: hypothetical protein WB676_03135 [Bryobacteraceae bacterium]